jgi:hypothetical protein
MKPTKEQYWITASGYWVVSSKINELAERADCTIDGLGYGEGNIEKFAEKIIQECIDVINNDIKYNQLILHNDTSYKIHNMASLTCVIGKIKQHFGLE